MSEAAESCACFPGCCRGGDVVDGRLANGSRCKAQMPAPDPDRIRALLDYCPASGVLRWRVQLARKIKAGQAAGSPCRRGYLRIRIEGRLYQAHRLAWAWMTGLNPSPALVVDHINGNGSDNCWANLRLVDHAVNMQNQRRARKGTASGYLGVRRSRTGGTRWLASIKVNGRCITLGTYDVASEAHSAYLEAKRRLHDGGTI